MSLHGDKRGFTLVENLMALACVPTILIIAMSLLKVMVDYRSEGLPQIEVLDLQLRQTLSRSSSIIFYSDSLTYSYNNQNFTISKDGDRLVRTPGYEILLTDLKSFNIMDKVIEICDEEQCIEI